MEPNYFDIHAHVQFDGYDADRDEVIERALSEGVHMMNVGTDADTSRSAIALAEKYDGLYAAVALHPADNMKEVFDSALYEELARHPKVKAIGECGLDYFHMESDNAERQKEIFIQHIEIANKVGKPLMLHIRSGKDRSAYKDAAEIIQSHAKVKGDVHFFAGTWEEAQLFLDQGFTLSFTGVLTFTHDYDEVVRNTPLDMLMAETDCPFVTPAPFRGKRNEPIHVREIYKAIARIKGLNEETVRTQIVANAKRVFGF
jgi:TatD DNase family protein